MLGYEERDLTHLAEYDFTDRNEAEIRGDWIEPLLRLLGYGLGTRHRVNRETQLQLRPPTRMIGSSRIEIDFVPTVFGHRLWIIEAKRPQDDLFSGDHLGQAWSYATDPRVAVPLMVLCDGRRLAVFDVTRANWDTPIFDAPKATLPETFGELFATIGAPRVAEATRRRQLLHLREALEAQVDLDALEATVRDVQGIVDAARLVRRFGDAVERDEQTRNNLAHVFSLVSRLPSRPQSPALSCPSLGPRT
jgi:type I site-specific restriction endonuclease